MLKSDRNGQYVIVYTYPDGHVIRKYENHTFRKYSGRADWNSDFTEMMWIQLPPEVQGKGEQYDIVCTDETDPYKPELRRYVRYPFYEYSGRLYRQVEHWEPGFLKFQIWRKPQEWDTFEKKERYDFVQNEEQANKLKERWESKKAQWESESKRNPKMDKRDWHQEWEKRYMTLQKWIAESRKDVKFLCELLLNNR
jgi:hypothetical protein